MRDQQRFTWAPVAALPGQDEAERRLGAERDTPAGDTVRGHIVERQSHRRRDNEGSWHWSVGIYRSGGVYFSDSGSANSSQEAADSANAGVAQVIARARQHDARETAVEGIMSAPGLAAVAGQHPTSRSKVRLSSSTAC